MGLYDDFQEMVDELKYSLEDLSKVKTKLNKDIEDIENYWNGISGTAAKGVLKDLLEDLSVVESEMKLMKEHLTHNLEVFKSVREDKENDLVDKAGILDWIPQKFNDAIDGCENEIYLNDKYYAGYEIKHKYK